MSSKLEHWYIFQNDTLVVSSNMVLPQGSLLSILRSNFIREFNLGAFNQIPYFCAELDAAFLLPNELTQLPLRNAFEVIGNEWYSAAVKAYSIIAWDKNHQFCGRCSAPTKQKEGVFERYCEHCGLVVYPRISPSAIVLIKRGEEILMARSPHFSPGRYGLIAGFVEAGESIEDAVHREVAEEVSLKITNLEYFGSQPWPFPDSLMIGFTADYLSGELKIDGVEIEAADWYRYDNLPCTPSNISLSGKLVQHYLATMNKKP